MKKQVKLNENDVRNLVQESVHQLMLEKNWNWRNWFRRNNSNDDWDEEEGQSETPRDFNGGDDEEINYEPNGTGETPSPNLFPNTPRVDGEFSYGGDSNSDTHISLGNEGEQPEINTGEEGGYIGNTNNWNSEDDENSPQGNEEQPQQPQVSAQPQNNQGQRNDQQAQPTQQPQQPAYRRGAKYHVAFSKENEDMFENHIKPTYNNLNGVIKSLTALRQIGEHNYNQASSIFGEWGQQNYNGGQPAFKAVCQQIDSIMPTLNNLKKEMKSVLMANGVRDTEDYQHYNMEEQTLRRIVNNSIQKVLSECFKK